ncbi:PH domain-containing protein [Stomatohabitans albus]|uniref:PH domain-containing protein n=1 Tax=Stomatohabitans albus TaxID=3110766 RepID=UPI00300D9BEB
MTTPEHQGSEPLLGSSQPDVQGAVEREGVSGDTPSQTVNLPDPGEWQRTSPWTLVGLFGQVAWVLVAYFFYNFAMVGSMVFLPGPVIEQIEAIFPFLTPVVIEALLNLFVPIVVGLVPVGRWLTIRWRLDEQTIEMRQGILFQKHQKMARSRVQNVTLKANPFARITNTRSVVVSSGDTEDIVIELVDVALADRLRIAIAPQMGTAIQPDAALINDPVREALFRHRKTGTTRRHQSVEGVGASAEEKIAPSIPIDNAGQVGHTSRVDIAHLGVKEWLLFVLMAAAPSIMITLALAVPVLIVVWFSMFGVGTDLAGLIAAASIPVVIVSLLPIVFGIVASQLNNWGFTSWIQDGRIHSVQGLFSRYEKGASLGRIQSVSIGQNPLRLWLKLDEVTIATADATANIEKNYDSSLRLVHPLLPAGQWRELAQDLLGVTIPTQLNRPSRRAIYRGFIRTLQVGFPVVILAGIVESVIACSAYSALVLAVLTLAIAYPIGLWRYHNQRWAINEECFVIRRGLVFRSISIVPLTLIQNIKERETFAQRRLGLGDVDADVAGIHAPKVSAHDLERVDALRVEAQVSAYARQGANRDGV